MTVRYPPAAVDEVRLALQRHRPELARLEIVLLGEGWDFCAFAAGDHVVRVPKVDTLWTANAGMPVLQRLQIECRLQADLAPTLPLPIPIPVLYEDGPNGLPFTVYTLVPGCSLSKLTRPAAADFGASLGRLLKALHAFPARRAGEIGVDMLDGASTRQKRIEWYEMVARRIFPLLSCEARTHTVDRFEMYLNDAANFAFEPRLVHSDIDERNLLADPETGALSGIIDFGDAFVGDPAGDFTWPLLVGLDRLGITDQIPALLREGGVRDDELRSRCEFYKFCQPFHQIIYGLDIGDEDEVAEGLQRLNATVPFGTRC